jgi:membrane-bound lytic murein transglycosylase B
VQPYFLIAFWGLETNFGTFTGNKSVIRSLATLAFDTRRSDFFRRELLEALGIVDAGHVPADGFQGSWAGATGQLQFMPSTFNAYAVDGDGDGKLDIWNSYPDMFASAANYLNSVGWHSKEIWGREVRLPAKFDLSLAVLDVEKPIADWQNLGVRRADGRNLPRAALSSSIILPGGAEGPAFLVYRNFRSILVWNRSLLYALSVGHLSDQIIHLGNLRAARPKKEKPLRRTEVEEMQTMLLHLGFDPGRPDGVVGTMTRAAIRAYQRQADLPADGYPTVALLKGLRTKVAN